MFPFSFRFHRSGDGHTIPSNWIPVRRFRGISLFLEAGLPPFICELLYPSDLIFVDMVSSHASKSFRKKRSVASEFSDPKTKDQPGGKDKDSTPLFDGGDREDEGTLTINRDYARRYDERKRREELRKNKDLLNDESESSESEDEDGELLTQRVNNKVLDTLYKIKKKDPSVYDQNVRFFEDKDFEEEPDEKKHDSSEGTSLNRKPVLYKDVLREALSSGGAEVFVQEEEDFERRAEEQEAVPTYREEQVSLKNAFLAAVDDALEGEGDETLLKKKVKSKQEMEDEDADYQLFLKVFNVAKSGTGQ